MEGPIRRGWLGLSGFVWGVIAFAVLACAIVIPLGLRHFRQRWALQQIEQRGAKVVAEQGGPQWLRKRVGNEPMKSFDKIVQVRAETIEQADQLEPALKALPAAPQLTVTDSEGGFREVYFEGSSKTSRAKAGMAFLDRHPALINALDSSSAAPLHLAMQFDDLELLEYLLAHKANVNIVDGQGLTPLHLARKADVARRLIKAGAELEARSPDGGTPLELATSHIGFMYPHKSSAVVDVLLSSGARKTLRVACAMQDLELARKLLNESPQSANDKDALSEAAATGNVELVKLFLDRGASVKEYAVSGPHGSPMTIAYFALPHADVLKLLLDAGADPQEAWKRSSSSSDQTYTLLHVAAERGSVDCCRLLMERGAPSDVEAWGRTPLHTAVCTKSVELVKLFLEHGADLGKKSDKHSATMLAVLNASPSGWKDANEKISLDKKSLPARREIIKLLIQHGHPLDLDAALLIKDVAGFDRLVAELRQKQMPPEYGWERYLRAAVEMNEPHFVECLLDAGAPTNGKDKQGNTLLHQTINHNCVETAALLIKRGAEVSAANREGLTPLDLAVDPPYSLFKLEVDPQFEARRGEVIRLLLAQGIPPDLWTALALHDVPAIKELFRRSPALMHAKDKQDQTPLKHAVARDQRDIVALLLAAEADIKPMPDGLVSALHYAAGLNRTEILQMLLKHGVPADALDEGSSPLHLAVMFHHLESAKILLGAGADPHLKNEEGASPLEVARESLEDYQEIAERVPPSTTHLLTTASTAVSRRMMEEMVKLLSEHK